MTIDERALPQIPIGTTEALSPQVCSTFPKVVIRATPQNVWSHSVAEQLNAVGILGRGWNSYNALPPSDKSIKTAIRVLQEVMHDATPPPQVIPTVSGGIQLEWHTCGIDLEIECSPDGRCSAYVMDEENDFEEEFEGTIYRTCARLNPITHRLTQRALRSLTEH